MASKAVYLYRVEMGKGKKTEETVYCYARNAGIAVDNLKQICKEKKYDLFQAKMFGMTNPKVHTLPFELMSKEEADYVMNAKLSDAAAYAQRKDPTPTIMQEMLEKGTFEQASKGAGL